MYIVIDRIEGEMLVVQLGDGTMADLPAIIAPDAKEGDVLSIVVDKDETSRRKQDVDAMVEKLWND